MNILSTEIVFRGHPDKLADQIGDKILMEYMKKDKNSIVNVDVVGGEKTVFITGETYASEHIDVNKAVKDILNDVKCCSNVTIIDKIEKKKPKDLNDIEHLVSEDEENIVYGYACNETEQLLPKGMIILQEIAKKYEELRQKDSHFLSDGKVIMEGLYNDQGDLVKIKSISVNHQNTGEDIDYIEETMKELIMDVINKYEVDLENLSLNPYGDYLLGGFDRDSGLTGRKLEIDTYYGFAPTTKVNLNGKDPYSIRSGLYKARELAKKYLKEKELKWCEVQLIYDKNKYSNEPKTILINSDEGFLNIDNKESLYIECIPNNIVNELNLTEVDFINLSSYGHIQN